MDLNLADKIAIVTGGNRGLGAASARMLASEGAHLLLTARDLETLNQTADEISSQYRVDVVTYSADLTGISAAEKIVAAALERFGRIDILINSAGASQGGVFWDIPDEVWQDSLNLKFMATIRMLRAVLPVMRENGYGRIVSVVGNTGKQPSSRLLPGAAANAALLAVTKGLADEVAAQGIVVNAINPGPTRTERWNTLMTNLAASAGKPVSEIEAGFLEKIPMDRLGEPEEIARIIAFLASDAAANMTGTSITADGGWTQALA